MSKGKYNTKDTAVHVTMETAGSMASWCKIITREVKPACKVKPMQHSRLPNAWVVGTTGSTI